MKKYLFLLLLLTTAIINAQVGTPYTITPQLKLKTIPPGVKQDSVLVADSQGRVRYVIQSSIGEIPNLQQVLNKNNSSTDRGIEFRDSDSNSRSELGASTFYLRNDYTAQNLAIQADAIRGFNDDETKINKLDFTKSTTGSALFKFPETTGTKILATEEDLANVTLQTTLNNGKTAEYESGNAYLKLLDGTSGNRKVNFGMTNGGNLYTTFLQNPYYSSQIAGTNVGSVNASIYLSPDGAEFTKYYGAQERRWKFPVSQPAGNYTFASTLDINLQNALNGGKTASYDSGDSQIDLLIGDNVDDRSNQLHIGDSEKYSDLTQFRSSIGITGKYNDDQSSFLVNQGKVLISQSKNSNFTNVSFEDPVSESNIKVPSPDISGNYKFALVADGSAGFVTLDTEQTITKKKELTVIGETAIVVNQNDTGQSGIIVRNNGTALDPSYVAYVDGTNAGGGTGYSTEMDGNTQGDSFKSNAQVGATGNAFKAQLNGVDTYSIAHNGFVYGKSGMLLEVTEGLGDTFGIRQGENDVYRVSDNGLLTINTNNAASIPALAVEINDGKCTIGSEGAIAINTISDSTPLKIDSPEGQYEFGSNGHVYIDAHDNGSLNILESNRAINIITPNGNFNLLDGNTGMQVITPKGLVNLLDGNDSYIIATDANTTYNNSIQLSPYEAYFATNDITNGTNSSITANKEGSVQIITNGGIATYNSNEIATVNNVPLYYTSATTSALTSDTLNSTYPAATKGSHVQALSIIGGGMIYEKTATGWATILATVTP